MINEIKKTIDNLVTFSEQENSYYPKEKKQYYINSFIKTENSIEQLLTLLKNQPMDDKLNLLLLLNNLKIEYKNYCELIEQIHRDIISLLKIYGNKREIQEQKNLLSDYVKKEIAIKTSEKLFEYNHIYILENLDQRSLIVNNNYQGLYILDCHMNIINSVELDNDTAVGNILVNDNGTELLVECNENEYLLHINLDTHDIQKISITLDQFSLSKKYFWSNDTIILVSNNFEGSYVFFTLKDKILHEIPAEVAQSANPDFFQFCLEIDKHDTCQIESHKKLYIFLDRDSELVTYSDYPTKKNISTPLPHFDFHEVIYYEDYFVFISESYGYIRKNGYAQIIKPNDGFRMLHARFVKNDSDIFLVIILINNLNSKTSIIKTYKLH